MPSLSYTRFTENSERFHFSVKDRALYTYMCKTQDSEVALGTPWLLSLYQLKYSAKIVGVPVRYGKKYWIIAPCQVHAKHVYISQLNFIWIWWNYTSLPTRSLTNTSHVHRTQLLGSCPGICGVQELLCLYIVERNLQSGNFTSEIKTKFQCKIYWQVRMIIYHRQTEESV